MTCISPPLALTRSWLRLRCVLGGVLWRMWRVCVAFFPWLAAADDTFAQQQLSAAEYQLYMQMDVRDRYHGCLVAKRLRSEYPAASMALLRAALLHDVGKSCLRYQPLSRVLVHLYTPRDIPSTPAQRGLRRLWQVHRYHPCYGAAMIRAAGGHHRVAELVAKHHNPQGDSEAAQLASIDALY